MPGTGQKIGTSIPQIRLARFDQCPLGLRIVRLETKASSKRFYIRSSFLAKADGSPLSLGPVKPGTMVQLDFNTIAEDQGKTFAELRDQLEADFGFKPWETIKVLEDRGSYSKALYHQCLNEMHQSNHSNKVGNLHARQAA